MADATVAMVRGAILASLAWLAAVGPGALAAAPPSTPAESLAQDLSELRKNPRDKDLRERIIKQALATTPAPPVPGEVYELEGRAAAAFKDAKTPQDYLDAVNSLAQALLLAPWVSNDYLSLADAQEKAGQDLDAAASLGLYLVAAPQARDANEVRRRIGALKYRAEKAAAPRPPRGQESGRAPQWAQVLERFKKLAGGRYVATYQCGRYTPIQALSKRERMECDREEYESGRWHKFDMLDTHEFRFPAEGTVQLLSIRTFQKSVELLGRPGGPDFKDIAWTACDKARECSQPAWVHLSEDLSVITFSPDRPVDDSAFDPDARYSYTQYRRE
ncbi:MAG: hypothetical protein NTY77_08510 [Elusimicrobia bacterium]|nr:hypothetical protein [Elusimicrobiota bacterium]